MTNINILEKYYEKYGSLVMETTLMYLKYFFEKHEDLFSLRDKIPENYKLNSIRNILLFAELGKLLEKIPLEYNVQWEDKKFGRYMKHISEEIMTHLEKFSVENFENAINDDMHIGLNMNEIISFDKFEIHQRLFVQFLAFDEELFHNEQLENEDIPEEIEENEEIEKPLMIGIDDFGWNITIIDTDKNEILFSTSKYLSK